MGSGQQGVAERGSVLSGPASARCADRACACGAARVPAAEGGVRGRRCGDSCAPGIGVPAAAASGMIAANTLSSVKSQLALLDELAL
jgi:hypothetical protein